MNHIPVHKLSEYIDGTIDIEDRKAIEEHITICPQCNKNLIQIKNMIILLSQLASMELPSQFSTLTLSYIKKHQQRKRHLRYLGAFAASILLIVSASIVYRTFESKDQLTHQLSHPENEITKLDCIIPTNIDFDTAIELITQYNGRIVCKSPSYIIAESDPISFSSIKQVLHSYESHYSFISSNFVPITNRANTFTTYPTTTHSKKKKFVFRLQFQ